MSSSTASRLDALIGLSGAKKVVRKIATGGPGVHSVLFYGLEGSGKEELARVLAELWLCKNRTSEGADGKCQPCGAFARGVNPDLLVIEPAGLSNLITIRQFLNENPKEDDPVPMLTFFRTGPLMSAHKVAIISDAHRMVDAASNTLLKTLEEPFPHAKLILTTNSIGSIRPTILSRCLAVSCSAPLPSEMSAKYPSATDEDMQMAEGSPGRLARIAASPGPYRALFGFARSLKTRSPKESLPTSEEFRAIAEGIDQARKTGARASQAEALSLLATLLARDTESPVEWSDLVIEAHRRILGNASSTILFDALFSQMLIR